MADDLQKLLTYIVDRPLMQNESREAELDATAVRDVRQEIEGIATDRHKDAERLAPYFARGLRLAAAANGPLTIDDTDPMGNSIADAFARYLVAPNLATSQSAPLSDSHYRYSFEVNWNLLREMAGRAGIDLDAALAAG